MNILLGINTLDTGGAENFVFRLAKAFSENGHKVYLFVLYDWNLQDGKNRLKKILGEEYSNVTVITRWKPGKSYDFVLWRWNRLCGYIGIKNKRDSIIERKQIIKLGSFIKKEKIDIINTHLWEVDEYISKHINIPHVISMHGPYELYLHKDNTGNPGKKILNHEFVEKAKVVINKSRHIIYVADKNLEILNYIKSENFLTEKIYLGYCANEEKTHDPRTGSDFVFGMMARGIESKGWEIACSAYAALTDLHSNTRLSLSYTETEYMKVLAEKFRNQPCIEFFGFTDDPAVFFNKIDAFILPSWDDCLPLSIIESLSYGVPVISTEEGEIPNMVVHKGKYAGVIVPIDENTGKPVLADIVGAMEKYLLDKQTYTEHKENTSWVSQKFSMKDCKEKYLDFYKKTIRDFNR